MQIKHNDLEITEAAPFANCQLGREQYANVLTSIVSNYADGFVLAINNEWGTGKTTFVKMWQKHLGNAGFETLYFNAWENDFESNPLVAILSELKTLTGDHDKKKFKTLLKKGAVLTKNVLPAVAKAMLDRYVDNEMLLKGIEDATKAATDILEKEVEGYASRKSSLKEFRKQLEEYLKGTESTKPVIFIIDELDRCRPSYAVEVLEQMKHFFAVSGIVFVLAIDKVQLGHAIRGIYGSEQLNADEYLRRFIDIEYSIPVPDTKQFNKYLYDYYSFDDFFISTERRKYVTGSEERISFLSLADVLFEMKKPTLRQQEKIFAHARLALKTFSFSNYLFPNLFLFLVYIKMLKGNLYQAMETKSISLQDLSDEYFKIVSVSQNDEMSNHSFLYMEAQLINMYNNYLSGYNAKPLLIKDSNGGMGKSLIKSKLDKSENYIEFAEMITSLNRDPDRGRTSLEHLLKRINLIEPVLT